MAKAKSKKPASRAAKKTAAMNNRHPLLGRGVYDGKNTCEIVEAVGEDYVIVQNFTIGDDNDLELTDQTLRSIDSFADPTISLFEDVEAMLEYIQERSSDGTTLDSRPEPEPA